MAIGQVGCGVNLLCCSLNPSRSTARHAGSWAVGEAASVSAGEEAPHSVDWLRIPFQFTSPAAIRKSVVHQAWLLIAIESNIQHGWCGTTGTLQPQRCLQE